MKVKKKILIASILLSLTAIILLCTFIGCEQRAAKSIENVRISNETSQQRQDVSETESNMAMEQTLVMLGDKKDVDESIKPAISQTPLSVVTYEPADPQDNTPSLKPESEEISKYGVIRSPAFVPAQKLAEDGEIAGMGVVTYEWSGHDSDMYGSGMMGGMGGMGGYGPGRQPASTPSSYRRARGNTKYMIDPRGPVPDRRMPADLLNVTADEVWVIAKAESQAVPPSEDTPGCGAMLARVPKEEKEIPLPLKHTDVKGQISGYIATVDVTQQFHNPYDEKIEAV